MDATLDPGCRIFLLSQQPTLIKEILATSQFQGLGLSTHMPCANHRPKFVLARWIQICGDFHDASHELPLEACKQSQGRPVKKRSSENIALRKRVHQNLIPLSQATWNG